MAGWKRQLVLLVASFAVTCGVVALASDSLATGMTLAQITFSVTLVWVLVRAAG